jgi:hypothetical protein
VIDTKTELRKFEELRRQARIERSERPQQVPASLHVLDAVRMQLTRMGDDFYYVPDDYHGKLPLANFVGILPPDRTELDIWKRGSQHFLDAQRDIDRKKNTVRRIKF